MKRICIHLSGRVQGVGFRPFVYRLATELNLYGQVCNTSAGVLIEAQGEEAVLADFVNRLQNHAPRLAVITGISTSDLPVQPEQEAAFVIVASPDGQGAQTVLVSPDAATCEDCKAELFDPADRRYLYPFINCTNCGPRYTITHAIPYDRKTTSMACFPLCPACAQEYADPANRRFHAEPVACPACGPHVWLTGPAGTPVAHGHAAITQAATALAEGRIVAVRGLGGFHLACNAHDEQAIARLRQRKHRPHKALAVMVADISVARSLADIDDDEAALLQCEASPIVLLRRKAHALPASIAPDVDTVGLMLAYTPLHLVLLHACLQATPSDGATGQQPLNALVMTSGNASGEPLCVGNREALATLGGYADCFLLHNRDILIRADDSVVRVVEGNTQFFRRARGYTPSPLPLPVPVPEPVAFPEPAHSEAVVSMHTADAVNALALGADMKNTLCLSRGENAFVSQHIGDMESLAVQAFAQFTATHLSGLLETTVGAVLADLHPGYHSTRLAREFAGQPKQASAYAGQLEQACLSSGPHELARAHAGKSTLPLHFIQHHEAHLYAVLGENANNGPALGLLLDGTGFGPDNTIWGGELLLAAPGAETKRLGRLSPFFLPGGERAIVEPWRIAVGLCVQNDLPLPATLTNFALWPNIAEAMRVSTFPLTSSCGRLFDAVSAVLGLCGSISYEGQAAIRLESAQTLDPVTFEPAPVQWNDNETEPLIELCSVSLFREAAQSPDPVPVRARRFHLSLIHGLARMAHMAAEKTGVTTVALGGGVLQNRTVAVELPRALNALGLTPLLPKGLPPGDGAISYGQMVRFVSMQNTTTLSE